LSKSFTDVSALFQQQNRFAAFNGGHAVGISVTHRNVDSLNPDTQGATSLPSGGRLSGKIG